MNESPTQDAPTQEATGSTNEAAGEPNASPTGPSAPSGLEAPAAEALAAEPPIAPDVPRLERPAGTANAIPETILGPRPSPMFLAVVSITSLVADVVTKLWAEKRLEGYPGYVNVLDDHLMFVLAKNKGGAWGLLQGQSENVRRPFFLLVSVAAIAFIVTLYRRLQPRQHALKWGLPLVLGGALGNVFDRIRYGFVIDFIDYRSEWIRTMNELIAKRTPGHIVTDHWPTFNVADIAICVGVGLMAIDMLTARRGKKELAADVPLEPEAPPAEAPVAEAAPGEAATATEEASAPIDASAEPTKSEG
ncbi:Lipoprotein signal peptidase [Labilithrix luteola]|uniref:Lipoprotein signal peptidase n=1 Tax=Labilithrix luteola TaxID=1391654 RepID=A0A0K1Q948_9BACT|nr:signal peptidase II [Labilithrix luteola]AKV02248.1 Lipoprotein signal peptidase [Labilithrix luteola]